MGLAAAATAGCAGMDGRRDGSQLLYYTPSTLLRPYAAGISWADEGHSVRTRYASSSG
jgi:hypothetical protein